MKITLHKPQREAVNTVLAYHDESHPLWDCNQADYWYDTGTYFAYWECDATCRGVSCYYEEDAGECTMWERPSSDYTIAGCLG